MLADYVDLDHQCDVSSHTHLKKAWKCGTRTEMTNADTVQLAQGDAHLTCNAELPTALL
jgi:hypothetical protein